MAKRRLKKDVIPKMGGILILIILLVSLVKYLGYRSTNEFKLKQLGYKQTEIKVILSLEKDMIKDILSREYNETIVSLIEQKYFMYKNLDRYLAYYEKNPKDKLEHIISIVNVNADYEYYDEEVVSKANINDGNLVLVNKYHNLDNDYSYGNLVDVSNWYCYGENKLVEEVYESFVKMFNDAKKEGLKLIIYSSYRDYDYQDNLYNDYKKKKGTEYADNYAARAGYSEHQTGLAMDLISKNPDIDDYSLTDEYKWLLKNAHKYGFILRYPKDKEDITGYKYEPWHYRYVGIEVATKIHELDITYDEYYAYYLDK